MGAAANSIHDTPLALRPLEPGEPPSYAGLHRDSRGMVVGAQGLVLMRSARHRAEFLAAFSHVADLSAGVQVEQPAAAESGQSAWFPVMLTPPQDNSPPSLFYDTVRSALAVVRPGSTHTRLYVGDGRVFVPYFCPTMPHGCDVQGTIPDAGRVLLQPHEAYRLPPPESVHLLAALLEVTLQPARQAPPPLTLAVLTDRRLAATVADYVQRHGLACVVRFLNWQRGSASSQAALFDIVHASEVKPIPGFVCDFLERLPRTVLLNDALEPASLEHEPPRRVLVAWGSHTPLALSHVQEILPASALLIQAPPPWGAALLDAPPPRQPMHQLTSVAVSIPASTTISDQKPHSLRLSLRLLRGTAAAGPVHALLLDSRALQRLRRIVRHLPAPLFAHTLVATGEDVALLVADAPQATIEGLPIGQPLARAEPPGLLLPRGMHLRPALPADLLIPALGLQPDTLTVLTPTRRYQVAQAALQPLASLLALDAPAHTTSISMQPAPSPLIDLGDLNDPGEALPSSPTEPPAAERPPTLPDQAAAAPSLPAPAADAPHSSEHSQPLASFAHELRRRAAQLEASGDYAAAAVFYDYLGDDQQATACYQRVLQQEQP